MPLPVRTSVCLLCRTRTTIPPSPSVLPTSWQATTRSMATLRTRRKASRMALSPNAGKSSLKSAKPNRDWRGPFSGMNQTVAPRIGGAAPRSRSAAAQKRSGEDDKPDKKKESPLYKALKMQTMLAPIGYGRRTAIKSKIASITSFDNFPLLPAVRQSIFSQALPGIANVTPTPIQRLAIPQLLDEGSGNKKKAKKEEAGEPQYDQYLLAAETGSGKTLAYLLPVVDAAKRGEVRDQEEQKVIEEQKAKEREERLKNRTFELEPEEAPMTDAGRPRVIILVPTSELVAQVGSTVKALAHTVKYRSGMISSNLSPRRIKNTLFHPSGIDILVSTPHLLSSIAKTNPYVLSRVSHLVLDEADSLMDKSFRPTTTEIIDKVAPSLKKLIFCSATIPRSLDTQLRKLYPDIKRLTTPKLHAIPRRVQLGVVDIEKDPYRGHRNLACADVIWSIGKAGPEESAGQLEQYMEPRVKKIIVFVNEREEAEEVAEFLQSKGIDAVSLSRDSSSRKHEEILAEFTDVATPPTSEEILLANKRRKQDKAIPFVLEKEDRPTRRLPDTKVLVTTDIASRGIDTLAVRTVVLYHVPHTTIDFIHRLGRLGRMGKRGRGVVLVGKKDRKDVVREVREGMFRGQALI